MIAAPRLYVDSADLDQVRDLLADSLVHGVTTNPTILERCGRTVAEIPDLYARWVEQGAQEVFFQTWGEDAAAMLRNADKIVGLGDKVAVKVPATRAGFTASRELVASGATVLVTAVYSVAQALAASAYGARYIAPYLGRLRDSGRDGSALIAEMQAVCAGSHTDVLAASLRSPADLVELRHHGVSYFTAAPEVIEAMLSDEISSSSAAEFEAAIARISS
ncbi:transaldolase family protein [Microbacterium sp. NPDC076911]|uniref:transaldolase family protein n=1 Tax=Microbacterium sp. NPDC076911 TaxID=3154958 RepID=UPI003448E0A1